MLYFMKIPTDYDKLFTVPESTQKFHDIARLLLKGCIERDPITLPVQYSGKVEHFKSQIAGLKTNETVVIQDPNGQENSITELMLFPSKLVVEKFAFLEKNETVTSLESTGWVENENDMHLLDDGSVLINRVPYLINMYDESPFEIFINSNNVESYLR
jgi:hypothetical protein